MWRRLPILLLALSGMPANGAPYLESAAARVDVRRMPASGPPASDGTRHPLSADVRQLLDAAFAADPRLTAATQRRLRRLTRHQLVDNRTGVATATTDWQRAERSFLYLHGRLLTGVYDPHCARLQRTLEDGTHNCLTGTLLYLALCRDANLPASPVASPGHVAVRVWLQGTAFDVETTDRNWRPRVAHLNDRTVRVITDAALIGRVHYNFGIRFAREENFEFALPSMRASYHLDPSHAAARSNLLATLNNGAIDLARHGKLRQAEALIQEGLRLDGSHESLRRSQSFVHQQRGTGASR